MTDVLCFTTPKASPTAFASSPTNWHQVTEPDLYKGATFETLDDGIGHAEQVGFDTIIERGGTRR